MALFRQFTYKKFGILPFDPTSSAQVNEAVYHPYIKILFLKKGSHVTIDFNTWKLKEDALFFINVNQWYQVDAEKNAAAGALLYYNRDFYCVEIHDREVACDGILYNNVYEIPVVYLSKGQSKVVQGIIDEIVLEVNNDESSMEEMLRILLKELIIKATRIWKTGHSVVSPEARPDVEFMRQFSRLVELHYKTEHTVAGYANMLAISPKILHKRITQHTPTAPNDLIKERIMLEAKRLLAHTALSVKEIGYNLGYDDPAYFVRLFTKLAGVSPVKFRKKYNGH